MSLLKKTGKSGEDSVCRYLKRRGYKVLERNFLVRGSEIDIIAMKDNRIHFVEVKTRSNDSFGEPADSIGYYKRKHIIYGAEKFLQKNKKYFDYYCSFDVAQVYYKKGIFKTNKIVYFEDAFIKGE